MVFSMDTIANKKEKPSCENILENITNHKEDESYFDEALSYILASSNMVRAILANVNGNKIDDIIYENKQDINPIDIDSNKILIKLHEWYNKSVSDMYSRFESDISKIIDNKDIKKNKAVLSSYLYDIEFNKPYYEYNKIYVSPNRTLLNDYISKVYAWMTISLSYLYMAKDNNDISNVIIDINIGNDYINEYRGAILNSDSNVSKEDFARLLYLKYRKSSEPINTGVVTNERIVRASDNFFDSYNILKSGVKTIIDNNKSSINELKLKEFTHKSDNYTATSIYNKVVADGVKEMKEICNITLLDIAARMDAIKELAETDRDILLAVLKKGDL